MIQSVPQSTNELSEIVKLPQGLLIAFITPLNVFPEIKIFACSMSDPTKSIPKTRKFLKLFPVIDTLSNFSINAV